MSALTAAQALREIRQGLLEERLRLISRYPLLATVEVSTLTRIALALLSPEQLEQALEREAQQAQVGSLLAQVLDAREEAEMEVKLPGKPLHPPTLRQGQQSARRSGRRAKKRSAARVASLPGVGEVDDAELEELFEDR